MKTFYNNSHPFPKLALTAFITLLCLIVSIIIAGVLAIPFFGVESFSNIINSSTSLDNSNISFLKYFQIIQSIGLFIIPSIILAYLFGGNILSYLRLNTIPYPQGIILAISIIVVSSPFINLLGELNSKMSLPDWMSGVEQWMRESEDSANVITKLFLKTGTIPGLILNIIMIGIIPALGEEFLFRGIIQRIFTEWTKNYHWGIWISAIIFSALHLQFYGFIPRVILGASFGYLLAWSGNLWFPVIAHFMNNTVAVIAYYMYNNGLINVDPDKIGTGSDYQIAAIISLVVMLFLFWSFYKVDKNLKARAKNTDQKEPFIIS